MTRVLKLSLFAFCSFEFLLVLGVGESSILRWAAFSFFIVLFLSRNRLERGKFLEAVFSKWGFAVVVAYFGLSRTALAIAQFYSFQLNTFDTGIYANLISNFRTSGHYYSSILGMPGLGNHFTPLLMLLSPLFALWPGPLVLILLKTLSFLVCGGILWILSRQELGKDHSLVFLPAMLWLSHKYVNQMMNFEFQPSSLSLPFIMAAFVFSARNRVGPMLLCLLICLGFKENLPVVWVAAGAFFYFYKGQKRLGIAYFGLGLLVYAVIRWWLMPEFSEGVAYPHADKFGPFSFLWRKFLLLFDALFSVGLLPVVAPSTLPLIVVGFGTALVSRTPEMLTYRYHYQDIGLAILLVAVVFAIKQRKITSESISGLLPSALFLIMVGFHSSYPTRTLIKQWPTADHIALGKELLQLKTADIPGPLCMLDALGPRFYERTDLKIIGKSDMTAQPSICRSLLISDLVDPWPLNEDYSTLKGKLEKQASQGAMVAKRNQYCSLFIHNESTSATTQN